MDEGKRLHRRQRTVGSFDSWGADMRLPVTLPFLIIASTRWEASRRRFAGFAATAVLLMLGLRIWTVSQSWRDYDRWFAEFRRAAAVITPGSRLLVVEGPMTEDNQRLPDVPPAARHSRVLSTVSTEVAADCLSVVWVKSI
jgi:hypothetical protein